MIPMGTRLQLDVDALDAVIALQFQKPWTAPPSTLTTVPVTKLARDRGTALEVKAAGQVAASWFR